MRVGESNGTELEMGQGMASTSPFSTRGQIRKLALSKMRVCSLPISNFGTEDAVPFTKKRTAGMNFAEIVTQISRHTRDGREGRDERT